MVFFLRKSSSNLNVSVHLNDKILYIRIMKHFSFLLFALLILLKSEAQPQLGITFQFEINKAFSNGNDLANNISSSKSQTKFGYGGKFGLIGQYPLNNNFSVESQLGISTRIFRYKNNIDSFTNKNVGSYTFVNLEIPLYLLLEWPNQRYTSKKYFGFGPLLDFNLRGISKYNETDLPFEKKHLNLSNNQWRNLYYGLAIFVGFEDSESQNLRFGLNYFPSGIFKSSLATIQYAQAFICYSYFY